MGRTTNSRLRTGILKCGACSCLVLLTASARASQWYVEPRVSLDTFYDDNVRLSTIDPRSTAGGNLTAAVESGRRTEESEIGLSAKVLSLYYTDASDLNETDGYLGFTSIYQLGRSRLGLDATFDYDSTLTSEVETSGLVQVEKRHQRVRVKPSWAYTLTDRARVEANLSYQDDTYQDVEVIPLFDYSFTTAGMSLIYGLTERAQVFGGLSYDKYDADQVDTQSSNYGVQAGASYLLTETMSLSSYAGVRNTHAETPTFFGTEKTDNTGPIFQVELKKSYDQGQLRMSAERSLLPSSSGTLLDTTALRLSWDYQFEPRWKFLFSASGYRNRTPDGEVSRDDRDYLAFSPSLQHQLTESLRLDLSYRYRWQEYDLQTSDASSNAVYLSLQYTMAKESLSKWSVLGK
nr:outer membrane beta-barrel protein [Thiocystis violacea]